MRSIFSQHYTLHIEFRVADVAETRDLDENTLLDIHRDRKHLRITVEHARDRAEIPKFSYEYSAS